MIRNPVSVAMRHLLRHKTSLLISISGLAAGIAVFVLIMLYLRHELTYDQFHKNAGRICLITGRDPLRGGDEIDAQTPDPLADKLRNDFPGLAGVVLCKGNDFPVTANGRRFTQRFLCASPSILTVFTFPLAVGDPSTALANVNSVVLTRGAAERFFGDEDPLGKTLTMFGRYSFTVTGVLKDIPGNSSIRFDILAPESLLYLAIPDFGKAWSSAGSYTFVQCSDRMSTAELEAQLPFIVRKYVPEWLRPRVQLGMIPLTKIHLSSHLRMDLEPTTSPATLALLFGLALAILGIACFNTMNLSIARYGERAKEIGVRKVVGATRTQLTVQFLGESVFTALVSLVLGLALAEVLVPQFNALAGTKLTLLAGITLPGFAALFAFGLMVGILAGAYPAFFLSSRGTIEVLKGAGSLPAGGIHWRRTLVFLQFAISSALIVSVLIVSAQLDFLRNHNLGFDPSGILAIPLGPADMSDATTQTDAYLNEIDAHKAELGIASATLSEHVPGSFYNNAFGAVPEGSPSSGPVVMNVTSIDANFLDCYGMSLAAGRNFSSGHGTDGPAAILLNETAARTLGWTDAVGKRISYTHGDGPFTVIGVVKDIHFQSLLSPIEPQVYRFAQWPYQKQFLSLRIRAGRSAEVIAFLADRWAKIGRGVPFDYFFVSEKYAGSYGREEKTREIFGGASLLAVLLACLGLSGIVALSVQQRTKEVGVRKVLGAGVPDLLGLLVKRFVLLVVATNLLAWPVAYYGMSRWLEGYPYRIAMSAGFFLLGGVLTLGVALVAAGSQAARAALADPVKAMRYE